MHELHAHPKTLESIGLDDLEKMADLLRERGLSTKAGVVEMAIPAELFISKPKPKADTIEAWNKRVASGEPHPHAEEYRAAREFYAIRKATKPAAPSTSKRRL